MPESPVKLEISDSIAIVTLNRPEKKNAMNPALNILMNETLEKLRYDNSAKVVVITGAGDAFCAGMDLKEHFMALRNDPAEIDRITRLAIEWRYRTLRYFPKPVISMINGFCFGGAFTIVEASDIAIAADEATFGLSEINFKLFPGGSVSKAIGNVLRPREALFYGLTGRPFKGQVAKDIGFVTMSVPLAQLRSETMAIAKELAAKDVAALRATKDAYRFSLEMSAEAAMNYSAAKEAQLLLAQNDSFREEGITDFLAGKYQPGLGGHEAIGSTAPPR